MTTQEEVLTNFQIKFRLKMAFQGQVKELKKRQHYSYDPFQHYEKKQYKTLRVVTSRQVAIYPSKLTTGAKLCDTCRKRITGLPSEIKFIT